MSSHLDIPQGPEDLKPKKRYRIRVAHEFDGTFVGMDADTGRCVFETEGKVLVVGQGVHPARRYIDPGQIVGIGEFK